MGLGPTEIVAIVLVALLLFGPGRIAGVGKGLGEGIRSFRSGLRGLAEDDTTAANAGAPEKPTKVARKPKRVRAKQAPVEGSPPRVRTVPARQS